MQFQADVLEVPVVRPEKSTKQRAGRRLSGQPGGGILEKCRCPGGAMATGSTFEPAMSAACRAALKAGWIKA